MRYKTDFNPTVYIMTNKNNNVFYIGVTTKPDGHFWQHKNDFFHGSFTRKYKCHKLVYTEQHERIDEAIWREKQLKNWHRLWKIDLINRHNPNWDDLTTKVQDSSLIETPDQVRSDESNKNK